MTIKLGANCWNQWADWKSLFEAGLRADAAGYDTLWTWDHLYPILGDPIGPNYEGWVTISAWAARTAQVRIGLLVGANPYRKPALVAKMATTLDHVSGGRAILGIGAGWIEEEAADFGIAFGSSMGERLRWLGEALPGLRGMLHELEPADDGLDLLTRRPRNLPPPLQSRLPILIGGGGEKVTLRLVAQWADMNNVGGGLEEVRTKERVLLQHCEAVGRNPNEIERTALIGTVFIRDNRADAERVAAAAFDQNRMAPWYAHCGTPESIADELAGYLDIGYQHLIANFPAPYDDESMTRFAVEVRAMLDRR